MVKINGEFLTCLFVLMVVAVGLLVTEESKVRTKIMGQIGNALQYSVEDKIITSEQLERLQVYIEREIKENR